MTAFRIVTAWLLVAWVASTADASPPASTIGGSGPLAGAPIKNYGIVDQGMLSRSAQPTHDGYVWLRGQGVESIVNLTVKDAGEGYLRQIGFDHYLWLPLQGPPTDGEAERFLKFVVDSRNWPLHVHCYEGKDRAGGLAALVRYAVDGWSLEPALEEAKLYRRGKALLPRWIDWLKHWAERHPPGTHQPVRMEGTAHGDGT